MNDASLPWDDEAPPDRRILVIAGQLKGMLDAGEFDGSPHAMRTLYGLITPLLNIAGDVGLMRADGPAERGA